MRGQDWVERAGELFEAAMFGGDASALDQSDAVLDAVEAPLSMSRGKVLHVRFLNDREENSQELVLFERAAELYKRLGDVSGEADALFWIGCWHQVVKGDGVAGAPYFERSYALAKSVDDRMTMSYAVRHLGFADKDAGHFDQARERLTESVTLRREIGFRPGKRPAWWRWPTSRPKPATRPRRCDTSTRRSRSPRAAAPRPCRGGSSRPGRSSDPRRRPGSTGPQPFDEAC
ncbi:tetratricopeptide repeat protein [Streptomyces sp. JCM17656]|nr:tetratricopeptide repeat protein [Streptomyces sp. JCM17656]